MRVTVCHNILWSKYKGVVFTALHSLALQKPVKYTFIQISATDSDRESLGGVDSSYHGYPYELLFDGPYAAVPVTELIWRLLSAVKSSRPELVILPGYDRVEYWALLLYCVATGRRRAVFCDSTALDRPKVWWKQVAKRVFFSLCDGFFAYGQRARDYLISLGAEADKIFFRCQAAALPHGYSPNQALRRRCVSRSNIPGKDLIYVGRLSKEKGLVDLLTAFDVFASTESEARLSLIGAGPLLSDLQVKIRSMRHGNRVMLLGSMPIAAIAERLTSALALVLPSHSEPWGLVVNEALSYGCPVVVSDACGCVPELVRAGRTGFAYASGNVEALVVALKATTTMVRDDEDGVAKNCIDHMADFTPEVAAGQIFEGCRRIMMS